MVCSKCEKKLARVAAPDPWKDGARNVVGGRDGGRLIGENKALSAAKRFSPYSARCTVCGMSMHQAGVYCQTCAYAKGVCSMCGVQILDTTYYKQTGGGDQNKAAKLKEANEELQRELREGTQADKRDAGGAGATAPALDRLAPRAAPSSRLAPGAHVTAALATAAPAGAAGVLQFQAGAWTGAKPGYFFGAGAHGVGYYPDAEQVRMASARDASAEVARAAGVAPPGHEASILSAGASAAALATAGVAPRHDPESMAAAAAAKAQLVGGTLTSSMGAAGRPVQKGGGGAGGPPPGWAYDSGSSMYYDTASQQYWDPARRLFYDCAAQTWSATPKGGGATVPATGGDGRKTRVPDKWGL